MKGTVSQFRPLVAGFPPLLPFDPRSSYVRFVVDKVTLRPVSPVNFHSNSCSHAPVALATTQHNLDTDSSVEIANGSDYFPVKLIM